MNILKVSESVIVCQNPKYYMVNSICVNLDSELLFIDTNTDLTISREFRKKMHEVFKVQKAVLTFTHSDYDHISGLEAYQDLQIVVSNEFKRRFTEKIESRKLNHLAFKPGETFSDNHIFGVEDNLLVFTLTGGHSEDSCHGYLPKEKILIAGDNLLSDMPQYLLQPDVDLKKLVDCLKDWKTLEIDNIIPGHGNVTNVQHMQKVLDYLESLHDFLNQARGNNLTTQEVIDHNELPRYFEPDPKDWMISGIKQVYYNLVEIH